MTIFRRAIGMMFALLLSTIIIGCNKQEPVSFSQNVKPIIDRYCIECHVVGGKGYEASGFSMESYETLMKGNQFGPMVIPGDSLGSNMLVLMEGRADPSINMPHGKEESVSETDTNTVRLWIDQGAQNN